MAMRLIELYGVSDKQENIEKLLEKVTIHGIWQESLPKKRIVTRILLDSEQTEPATNVLEEEYSHKEDFRIIILPVEAAIPRPEKKEEKKDEEKTEERKSIEELYQKTCEAVDISKTYYILIILASVVAAIGILYENIAVIIGSMVIAPMLMPSIALSLSTTLSDYNLTRKSLITGVSGYLIAIAIGVIFGLLFIIDTSTQQILFRTDINLMYVILALSAGIAGSLSFTKGVSQAIVGVMVAIALLPPLVTTGLLIGSQHWTAAFGSILLSAVNIVCINLAGVITFISQGITPKKWWEKQKAKKTTRRAIAVWSLLLISLIVMIWIYQNL